MTFTVTNPVHFSALAAVSGTIFLAAAKEKSLVTTL
jgi:hypothetical protein